MAKHKGRELEVFLDGYAQGVAHRHHRWLIGNSEYWWKDAQGVAHAAQRLRYTDALGVAYRPGGVLGQGEVEGPAQISDPGHVTATGTELQMADMERVKRRHMVYQPTAEDLALLGTRKACEAEYYCPVAPGCHICGLSKEEIEFLNKAKMRKNTP